MRRPQATIPGIAPPPPPLSSFKPDDAPVLEVVSIDAVVPHVPSPIEPKVLVEGGVPAIVETIPVKKPLDPADRKRRARTVYIEAPLQKVSAAWRWVAIVAVVGSAMGVAGWYLGHRHKHGPARRPPATVVATTPPPPPQADTTPSQAAPPPPPPPPAVSASVPAPPPPTRTPVRQPVPQRRPTPRFNDPLTL
jgi:hypothetical protein